MMIEIFAVVTGVLFTALASVLLIKSRKVSSSIALDESEKNSRESKDDVYKKYLNDSHKVKSSFLERFFWWCSGADINILEYLPNKERQLFLSIGALIFITSTIAALSGYIASLSITNSVAVSTIISIFWGLTIMMIDRVIISTYQKRTSSMTREAIILVPRILLSLCIGFIVAVPVGVHLLKDQIDKGIQADIYEEINKLREAQYAKLNEKSEEINRLKIQREEIFSQRDSLQSLLFNEIRGQTNGQIGYGNRAVTISEKIEVSENDINDINQSVYLLDSILSVESKLADQLVETQIVKVGYERNNFFNRVIKLEEIRTENKLVNNVYMFLLLFFMLMQILPVISKFISGQSLHDKILIQIERDQINDIMRMADK